MSVVQLSTMIGASLAGSATMLAALYVLLPLLGLPRLDFTAVMSGWVSATGRYAKVIGALLFMAGGMGWTFLYARYWPHHSMGGAVTYVLMPFAISCAAVLPLLNPVRSMVHPLPGFLWVKMGGGTALVANAIGHLIFGTCLGAFYR